MTDDPVAPSGLEQVRVEVRVTGLRSGRETVVVLPRVQDFEMDVPAHYGDAAWDLSLVFPRVRPVDLDRDLASFWVSGRCVEQVSIEHRSSP